MVDPSGRMFHDVHDGNKFDFLFTIGMLIVFYYIYVIMSIIDQGSFEDLGYSTSQIALISVFANIGQFSGVIGGSIFDYFGPIVTSKVSGLFFFSGYFFLWLQVAGKIGSSLGSLCFTVYIAQIGLSCASQISSSTSMIVVPDEVCAKSVGMAKAYYAIGGSVLACVARAFFDNKEHSYVLYIALSIPSNIIYINIYYFFLYYSFYISILSKFHTCDI